MFTRKESIYQRFMPLHNLLNSFTLFQISSQLLLAERLLVTLTRNLCTQINVTVAKSCKSIFTDDS